MATYRSRQYGFTFEMPDDATTEAINVKRGQMVEEHVRTAKGAAAGRPPVQPTGPQPPSGGSLEEFLGPMGPEPVGPMAGPEQEAALGMQPPAAPGTPGGRQWSPLEALVTGAPQPNTPMSWESSPEEVIGMRTKQLQGARAGPEGVLMSLIAGAGPAVGGARLGTALAAKLGGQGISKALGGALGGLLGEATAQKTGLVPESTLGLAGAALPIPASAVTRGIIKRLPGAAAGIKQAASPLWEAAETAATKAGIMVQPQEVAKVAKTLSDEVVGRVFATPGMKRLVKGGQALGAKTDIPFKEFRDEMVIVGRRVGALKRQGGPEYGEAKALYKAMQQDLNTVISTAPKALREQLKQAKSLSKEAAGSEKFGRAGTGITARAVLGGGGYAYGGPTGAAAAVAPDVIKAALESTPGRAIIAQMAKRGATYDEILNAIVQAGLVPMKEAEAEYTPPWETAVTP